MTDTDQLIAIQDRLRSFVAERDWAQFHDPKNLAMAVASEAGELLAELRWISTAAADDHISDEDVRSRVQDEIADVAITLLLLCERCNISLLEAIERKIAINEKLYPVPESRSNAERPGERRTLEDSESR